MAFRHRTSAGCTSCSVSSPSSPASSPLASPGQTFLVLSVIIAKAHPLRRDHGHRHVVHGARHQRPLVAALLLGIAEVLISFWAVGYTNRSVALLVIWVGASALARGISSIILGFRLHSAGKEVRKRILDPPPTPGTVL